MAHGLPAKRVCRTHTQLQPRLTCVWLLSAVHFKLKSSSPLHLIQLRYFTILLHNETQRCVTRRERGGISAVVYGCSGLSPVKTQLIVINSGPKMNFAWKRITFPSRKAALILHGGRITPLSRKSAASTTRKVKETFISERKHLVRHTAVFHTFVYIDHIA